MSQNHPTAQSNFAFLKEHNPLLLQLAVSAEQAFTSDPNTTLLKLRQLGEAIAQDLAVCCAIAFDEQTSQADLIYKLNRELRLKSTIRDLFHKIRIEGKRATHTFKTQHKEALDGLKIARNLAIWYHRSLGNQGDKFRPGPFVAPPDPSLELRNLQAQLRKLSAELIDANEQLESNQKFAELQKQEAELYAALAQEMDEEARNFSEKAREGEAALEAQQKLFEKRKPAKKKSRRKKIKV